TELDVFTPHDLNGIPFPPWGSSNLYYNISSSLQFNSRARTCEQNLQQQEVLLCAADKLSEVGRSVGTLKWDLKAPDNVTITIPPQATADRFIARDMALNVLAHLARLPLMNPSSFLRLPTRQHCIDAYTELAEFPDDGDVDGREVYLGPIKYFPQHAGEF